MRAFIVVIGILLLSVDGSAQSSARELFDQASELLQRGEYPESLRLFRLSLEEEPRVPTAVNIAEALLLLDQPIESLAVLDEIAGGSYGNHDEMRSFIREMRVRALARVGRIRIRVRGTPTALRLDGQPLSLDETIVRVNPGRHILEARADGTTHNVNLMVGAGSVAEAALVLNSFDDNEPRRSRAGLWVGLSVLVVALGVGLAIGLTRNRDDAPESAFPDISALHGR